MKGEAEKISSLWRGRGSRVVKTVVTEIIQYILSNDLLVTAPAENQHASQLDMHVCVQQGCSRQAHHATTRMKTRMAPTDDTAETCRSRLLVMLTTKAC